MNTEKTLVDYISRFRNLGVFAILVAMVVLVAIFSPGHNFIKTANIKSLLSLGSEFTILALGVGMLMIAGEFDISVGSVLAFSSLIFTWTLELGLHPFWGLLITLTGGCAVGLLHGLITTKAGIVSFVTTLGGMMFWRGLTLILSAGAMRPAKTEDFPVFQSLLTGKLGGYFPAQAIWFLAFAVILGFLLHRRPFGNWIYATGDNRLAARSMCINTDLVKIVCFVMVGFFCAFSGVIQTTRLSAFSSRVGTGWELRAIAAAVVGGTSLRGGRGSLVGIFLGALIIMIIENALVLARLPYEWTYMVFGLVIMFSVLLDLFIEKQIQKAA